VTLSTEGRNPRSFELDRLSAAEIVHLMDHEERDAFAAVEAAAAPIARVAELVAGVYTDGGRVVYLGAGTSGHIAIMDAAEIPATFGVDASRFVALVAGVALAGSRVIASSEDDVAAAPRALDKLGIGVGDVVIGLAASGSTPFVVAGVAHAQERGALTCGIANNPGASLLEVSAHPVLLDTGPEVVTGSTRLKAGTAQKLALNRISTTAMVISGHVVSNLMVEVRPSTDKLRARCVRIVCDLSGVDTTTATARLTRVGWSIRAALEDDDAERSLP
jgi:N-acetylmuramic acid 6-phosphate etherase